MLLMKKHSNSVRTEEEKSKGYLFNKMTLVNNFPTSYDILRRKTNAINKGLDKEKLYHQFETVIDQFFVSCLLALLIEQKIQGLRFYLSNLHLVCCCY